MKKVLKNVYFKIKAAIKKPIIRLVLLSFFNIAIAFVLIFTNPNIPFVKSAEIEFYSYVTGIKRVILNLGDDPNKDSLLFIDTSYDIELAKDKYSFGKEAIVDRKKLTECFKYLNQNQDKFKLIICDINFCHFTEYDTLMLKEIRGLNKKIIFPKDSNSIYADRLNSYWAAYEEKNGILLDIPLKYGNKITYPTAIYKYLNPKASIDTLNNILPFISIDNVLFPQNLIIEPRVRPEHLFLSEAGNIYIPNEKLSEFIKNKTLDKKPIIIIGNLNENGNDIHQSILNNTFGSIAVFNTYLMLKNKDSSITIWWITTMLFLLFYYFSREQSKRFKNFSQFKKLISSFSIWKKIDTFLIKIKKYSILKMSIQKNWEQIIKYLNISKKDYLSEISKSIGLITVIALVSYLIFDYQINFLSIGLIIHTEIFIYRTTILLKILFSRKHE